MIDLRPPGSLIMPLLCEQATLFNSNRRDLALVDSMLLDDLGQRFADDHLLHYTSCDYHMPLLQGNQHYRRWVTDMAPAFATVGRPLLQCAHPWFLTCKPDKGACAQHRCCRAVSSFSCSTPPRNGPASTDCTRSSLGCRCRMCGLCHAP